MLNECEIRFYLRDRWFFQIKNRVAICCLEDRCCFTKLKQKKIRTVVTTEKFVFKIKAFDSFSSASMERAPQKYPIVLTQKHQKELDGFTKSGPNGKINTLDNLKQKCNTHISTILYVSTREQLLRNVQDHKNVVNCRLRFNC